MSRPLTLLLCVAAPFLALSPAAARPNPENTLRLQEVDSGARSDAALAGRMLASGAFTDTIRYGGTVWAADSSRWEALRGGCWTFQTGLGSNFTEPTQYPKPPGYHHRAEGWKDFDRTYSDLPYFRRSTTCAINGSYSFWAGVTLSEANALCFAAGQGYGTGWILSLAKTFSDPGTGSVTLGYRYSVEAEPGYDYLHVEIDTTGNGSGEFVSITQYDGATSGLASHALVRGATLRSTPGNVTIRFRVTSDNAYDDQDGGYPTTCGHSAIDDITLTGAISENATFETDANGWALSPSSPGAGGLWMSLRTISSLPPPLVFCPCSMSDSVMVFMDGTGGHGAKLDNMAVSPWCDLLAGGDSGRPGKLIVFDGYFELALTNYIFVSTAASWYPAVCPATGKVYTQPLTTDGFARFFGGVPVCTSPGSPNIVDYSAIIGSQAEQIRIAIGALSFCDMFSQCTGVTNSTPWFDNIALGVFGTAGAPLVTMRPIDLFQDAFTRDGTLSPAGRARVDINTVKGSSFPAPGTALGDTLVISGDGGNQEVKVVFRVRPGPFTNLTDLNAWALSKWTNAGAAAPGYFGGTFWEARCDTAEQGGTIGTPRRWMSALHELDPKFGGGTDRDRGAEEDANQLSHDIFPDNILTPGSRIDYFIRARYLPPDPRNPGGANAFVLPDTSNGRYLEIEILPSSLAADTTWNCTLLVDHRADRDVPGQRLEEQSLTAALGSGSANAEGTRFDRYDVQAPSSQQASFGRPLNTAYGASVVQAFGYSAILWNSGNIAAFNLVDEDASVLQPWLNIDDPGNRHHFWGSGDGLARSMHSEAEATTINFLNNTLGVRYSCDTVRLALCPTGSLLDSTHCLPLAPVAGAHFATTVPTSLAGNGCPDLRSFDVVTPNTSVPTALRQLTYVKNGAPLAAPYAMSVTNHNLVDVEFRTVFDAADASRLREPSGSPHVPALCNVTTPLFQRTADVIQWFQLSGGSLVCRPLSFIGVPIDETPGPGLLHSALRAITPNPMQQAARIRYANARENGRVRIEIVDVTGRLVRRLQDLPEPAGVREAVWDGRDDRGGEVSRGMYFVILTTADARQSQKVVVAR